MWVRAVCVTPSDVCAAHGYPHYSNTLIFLFSSTGVICETVETKKLAQGPKPFLSLRQSHRLLVGEPEAGCRNVQGERVRFQLHWICFVASGLLF